jgi:hypothetical protein
MKAESMRLSDVPSCAAMSIPPFVQPELLRRSGGDEQCAQWCIMLANAVQPSSITVLVNSLAKSRVTRRKMGAWILPHGHVVVCGFAHPQFQAPTMTSMLMYSHGVFVTMLCHHPSPT